MKVEDFLNVHLMRSILNDLMKRTWSFKCFRVNLCYCSSVKYGLSGLQLGLTQSGGRLKSLEYLDVWWEQTHRSRTQSVSPLDGHPWVKCSSVRITTYQRGEWRRPCNFAVVLFECSETQNLGVLLTFWELPCRASPEEDFQPQQKKKRMRLECGRSCEVGLRPILLSEHLHGIHWNQNINSDHQISLVVHLSSPF